MFVVADRNRDTSARFAFEEPAIGLFSVRVENGARIFADRATSGHASTRCGITPRGRDTINIALARGGATTRGQVAYEWRTIDAARVRSARTDPIANFSNCAILHTDALAARCPFWVDLARSVAIARAVSQARCGLIVGAIVVRVEAGTSNSADAACTGNLHIATTREAKTGASCIAADTIHTDAGGAFTVGGARRTEV